MTTCRLCNADPNQAADKHTFLKRVNDYGVEGIWECFPSCGINPWPPEGNVLFLALEETEKTIIDQSKIIHLN